MADLSHADEHSMQKTGHIARATSHGSSGAAPCDAQGVRARWHVGTDSQHVSSHIRPGRVPAHTNGSLPSPISRLPPRIAYGPCPRRDLPQNSRDASQRTGTGDADAATAYGSVSIFVSRDWTYEHWHRLRGSSRVALSSRCEADASSARRLIPDAASGRSRYWHRRFAGTSQWHSNVRVRARVVLTRATSRRSPSPLHRSARQLMGAEAREYLRQETVSECQNVSRERMF